MEFLNSVCIFHIHQNQGLLACVQNSLWISYWKFLNNLLNRAFFNSLKPFNHRIKSDFWHEPVGEKWRLCRNSEIGEESIASCDKISKFPVFWRIRNPRLTSISWELRENRAHIQNHLKNQKNLLCECGVLIKPHPYSNTVGVWNIKRSTKEWFYRRNRMAFPVF